MDFSSSKPSSRARELHGARRDIGRYKERRLAAESAKARAEYELSNANKAVKDLASMIDESSYKAKSHMQDVTSVEKLGKVSRNDNSHESSQVMRELENVKQQLFQLKLDVDAVLEEKLRAEREIEASISSTLAGSRTAELLRKEIEEASEEQVLVELAKMDALKELGNIEAQRRKDANEFLLESEKTRNKLKEAAEEVEESKELEMKLAMTMSDVDVLQNELKLVKEMEKRVQRHESMEHIEGSSSAWEESRDSPVLESLETIKEEIEAAKKNLALIRKEGFRFMASMDVIRNEMKHVKAETVDLKKEETKAGLKVQNLSYKILRAKSKLEGLTAAEEKAKSIVISFLHTFDKLNAEIEAAKKEKELVDQEITTTKSEIKKAEFEKDMAEERLQGTMQELEAIKLSEGLALEKLKTLTENAMRDRGLDTQNGSSIAISKFEYEYLTNHAAEAKEIADKKVAAAKAWTEAVKASEKEIRIRTQIAENVIKETKLEDYNTRGKLVPKRVTREELEHWPRKGKKNASRDLQRSMSQKSIKSNGSVTPARGSKLQMTPARGSKLQKSSSPASRVSPFIIKKKKVIPSFAKFFRGNKNKRNNRT